MPALTETQLKVDKWSKCTLIGAVLLFVYSAFILLVSIHMDHEFHREHPEFRNEHNRHHGHHHSHSHDERPHAHMMKKHKMQPEKSASGSASATAGTERTVDDQHEYFQPPQRRDAPPLHHPQTPCRLHHFANLGLITAITGIIASFKNRRGWVLAFVILTLVAEISALGYIGFQNAKAIEMCNSMATTQRVQITGHEAVLPNGQKVEEISVVRAGASINEPLREECGKNVRHAAVIASLIVGVVACSLACCGSRFSNALTEREEEEQQELENATACVVTEAEGGEGDVTMKPVIAILVDQQKEQPVVI